MSRPSRSGRRFHSRVKSAVCGVRAFGRGIGPVRAFESSLGPARAAERGLSARFSVRFAAFRSSATDAAKGEHVMTYRALIQDLLECGRLGRIEAIAYDPIDDLWHLITTTEEHILDAY